ncbi:MAG: L,D-transpeptidase family protein [Pseudomonadota bacterium]
MLALLLLIAGGTRADPDTAVANALDALRLGDLNAADAAVAEALGQAPDFELAKALRADIASLLVGERSLFDTTRLAGLVGSEQRLWQGFAAEVRQRSRPVRVGERPLGLLAIASTTTTLLLAETERGQLHVVQRTADGWQVSQTLYVSIGKNGAGKRRSGDRRTPLGIYWVVGRLEDRQLPPRYGPLAFPLDYPNAWDRQLGRSGDGIWLHGTEPSTYARPPQDSDGCLVLSDELLLSLAPALSGSDVPVVIATEWRFGNEAVTTARGEAVLAEVERWVSEFRERRGRVATTVSATDIFAADYPEEPGLVLVRFRLVEAADQPRYSWKRLYLRLGDDDAYRIVATGNG